MQDSIFENYIFSYQSYKLHGLEVEKAQPSGKNVYRIKYAFIKERILHKTLRISAGFRLRVNN